MLNSEANSPDCVRSNCPDCEGELRVLRVIGGRAGNPASAVCNSGSRSSGHSPMNLVVTCMFPSGLH